jgi:hypothetical protein
MWPSDIGDRSQVGCNRFARNFVGSFGFLRLSLGSKFCGPHQLLGHFGDVSPPGRFTRAKG